MLLCIRARIFKRMYLHPRVFLVGMHAPHVDYTDRPHKHVHMHGDSCNWGKSFSKRCSVSFPNSFDKLQPLRIYLTDKQNTTEYLFSVSASYIFALF